jgi:hypothetical protein
MCDAFATCLGHVLVREGQALQPGVRNYLCGMLDATVKILEKSYGGEIPRELDGVLTRPM